MLTTIAYIYVLVLGFNAVVGKVFNNSVSVYRNKRIKSHNGHVKRLSVENGFIIGKWVNGEGEVLPYQVPFSLREILNKSVWYTWRLCLCKPRSCSYARSSFFLNP